MFKRKIGVLVASLCVLTGSLFAQQVKVLKDNGGWRLFDGNKSVEVKGVVWSFTPIGESYTYNLFGQNDDFIQKMIDTDMPMLKDMGVNVIRCFTTIPPKWVEYIYTKYGIYSIINDTLGRYGISVNGTWYDQTDYSDYYTRETLIAQARATAETYKNVNGVLMYMFGNESNYGLVWSSSEIENLPVGEQNVVKAGYLYDLLEKAMAACKEVDPNRPVGIVNGDTQYLDLIAKLCPSLDILGVNAYRGYKFYDSFYENIRDVLDKPIVFTESGADAYNNILHQEDQSAQMTYLGNQWQEIYEQSYGKGKCQNVLGGFVFEWMDEWWKRYQTKNVDVHDGGSWSNAGYELDYADGINNMSEEWFGLCAQSTITRDGINVRIPRASYYMLKDAWKLSLYESSAADVSKKFASLNYSLYLAMGNEKSIKQAVNEREYFKISQASLSAEATAPVFVNQVAKDIEDGTKNWKNDFRYLNSKGEMNEITPQAEAVLGIEFKPFENLSGEIVLKAASDAPFTRLGDAWASYYDEAGNVKYVELYSGSLSYEGKFADINGYYHTGHASFEGKGDPFSISKEAFDITGYDTYGSKAPIAVEVTGKNIFDGLSVIAGPEIWGSARPQLQANYYKWIPNVGFLDGIVLNATYAEEFGTSENIEIDPYNGYGAGRKASVYFETYLMPWFQLKGGALIAGTEKIGASYVSSDGKMKNIGFQDTLGGYVHLGTDMFQHTYIYGNAIYRGLVAETNAAAVRGSFFTADSGAGNRFEVQVGTDFGIGDFTFKPVVRARVPLDGPVGRNLLTGSPFIVDLRNRQSIEVEAVLTYDSEGGTWFHEWNSDDIEGAKFAASVSGLYQYYAGMTDNIPYKSNTKDTRTRNDGSTVTDYIWFDGGALPEQGNLWQVGARAVFNPIADLRIIAKVNAGQLGATTGAYKTTTGVPEIVTFVDAGLSVRYSHLIASADFSFNKWGPENWWRNFNYTFPLQYTVDVAYGFGKPSFLDSANRVGVRVKGRNFGKYSSDAYGALPSGMGVADAMYMEVATYFNISL